MTLSSSSLSTTLRTFHTAHSFTYQSLPAVPVTIQLSTFSKSHINKRCIIDMTLSSSSLSTTLRTFHTAHSFTYQSLPAVPVTIQLSTFSKSHIYSLKSNWVSVIGNNPEKLSFRVKSSLAEMNTKRGKAKSQVFDSEEDLSVTLAKYTADLSNKFIRERGAFTVALSGGSLIKSLRKLVESPYIDSVDWSKWHVFWVDERVVPKDHPDSNYKLAYDSFLSKVPILPDHVYAINDTLSAEDAADDYETQLKHLVKNKVLDLSEANGFPKFDLQLMGMGPDGHIASLFPGHPLVHENKLWVTFVKDSPKPPPERITLTFPVINSSAYIALVVVGSGKADVVQASLGNNQNSDMLPVQMVSPRGEMTWFLDKDAASKL